MNRKTILILLLCLALLSACSNGEPTEERDMEYYNLTVMLPNSVKMLIDDADIAIVAEVRKVEIIKYQTIDTEYDEDGMHEVVKPFPFTISTVLVEQVLKGDVEVGKKIQVTQLGDGITVGISGVDDGGGYLEKGSRVVLFVGQVADEFMDSFRELNNTELPPPVRQIVGHLKIGDDNTILEPNYEIQNLFGNGDDTPIRLEDVISAVNAALEAGK